MADSLSSLGGGLEGHSMAVTSKLKPAWVLLARQHETRGRARQDVSLSCLSDKLVLPISFLSRRVSHLILFLLLLPSLFFSLSFVRAFSIFLVVRVYRDARFGPVSCLNEVRSESNRLHRRLVPFSGNKRVRDTRFLILRISRGRTKRKRRRKKRR